MLIVTFVVGLKPNSLERLGRGGGRLCRLPVGRTYSKECDGNRDCDSRTKETVSSCHDEAPQPCTDSSPPSTDHLGRVAGIYQNTEHYSYTPTTFVEILTCLQGYRQPAPFARPEPNVPGWTIKEDKDEICAKECQQNLCDESTRCTQSESGDDEE